MSEATSPPKGAEIENSRIHRTRLCAVEIQDGPFVCTIGIARARTKTGVANLAYNLTRFPGTRGELRPA
ncbi:hypothetical protein AJ88_37470 [Mesorhizobium amorphae CCBAU 01583]|nr:hypothetical protein AJ88_37470 [Mesorhizobium amorphae CCBAU 01583]